MKHKAPTLREVSLHGKKTFLVTWPNPEGNRPNRKFFALEKKALAETFLQGRKIEFENFGRAAFAMPEALRSDAIRAQEIIAPTGKTLIDAARLFLDHWQKQNQGKPIDEAVEAFLKSKEGASNINQLTPRLRAFAGAMQGKTTASIEQIDIEAFLSGLEGYSPRTISHFRAHVSALFTFCKKNKWCTANPVEDIATPKVSDPEPEILTPQEARALLDACDDELLPAVAIGMFCGLRQAEIEKLDWSAVNVAEGIVTVGAKIAKTNSRRVVTMPECLKAFLEPYGASTGHVWPEGCRNKWNLARMSAGYGPFFSTDSRVQDAVAKAKKAKRKLKAWPHNALRHSCISYRVAKERDLAKIAYESGNSPTVIQKHYNGLASPKAAKEFFAIMPGQPENVVKITRAA